jgi:hypothetical protein
MGKKKVIWTKKAEIQMFAIMDYYANRNKSDSYSLKLKRAIDIKLSKIDFNVTLPKKASVKNIFYFVCNHISVFFTIESDNLYIILIWDERRNPALLLKSLESL